MIKKLPWGATLFFILGFPLLLRLGLWQLDRLEQKEHYLKWRHEQSQAQILTPEELDPDLNPQEYEFRHVKVKGNALPNSAFTILSRPHPSGKGLSGSYLLTPFCIEETKEVVIMNWGWIPNNGMVEAPYHPEPMEAVIRLPENLEGFTPPNTAQQYLTIIPAEFLAKILQNIPEGYKVQTGFYLQRLANPSELRIFPRALFAEPDIPNRHLEYAFTWFSFAFTLAIIYAIYLRRYIQKLK